MVDKMSSLTMNKESWLTDTGRWLDKAWSANTVWWTDKAWRLEGKGWWTAGRSSYMGLSSSCTSTTWETKVQRRRYWQEYPGAGNEQTRRRVRE